MAKFFCQGPDGISGFVGYLFSVPFLQPYHHIAKTDVDSAEMIKHGHVPIKMYLQKWVVGH